MRKPKSSQTNARKPALGKKKRDLIVEADQAAQTFALLTKDYNEAADGYRTGLYRFAARCYWIGRAFARKPETFQRFMRDAFWNDVRQKPKEHETIKAVLTFAMKAKSKNLQNRVTKTAAVLKSFDSLDLKLEYLVVGRLRAGGGIEKMYREISGKKIGGSALPDDLALLKPDSPDADEEVGDEADDGGEPETDSTDNKADDWSILSSQGDAETDENDFILGNASRGSVTNSSGLTPSKKVGEGSDSQPRFKRFDLGKHLAVELSKRDKTWILSAPQRIVIEADVGEEDETGWRPVKVVSVERTPWSDGPWLKSETDEEGD